MPLSLLSTYGTYLRGLLYFLRTGGDFADCPFLQTEAELPTKVRRVWGEGSRGLEAAAIAAVDSRGKSDRIDMPIHRSHRVSPPPLECG